MAFGVSQLEYFHYIHRDYGRLHCMFCQFRISHEMIVWLILFMQDIFLYAVIIPVMPFALAERAHIPQAKGASKSTFLPIEIDCSY
jgi:hypothetical protein